MSHLYPVAQFVAMVMLYRAFDEESKARMGVVECVTHKLLDPFDVLYDKDGTYVVQWYDITFKVQCYLISISISQF